MNNKKTIILCLLVMSLFTTSLLIIPVSAEIETNISYGTRNAVPEDAIRLDFENGWGNLMPLSDCYGDAVVFEGMGDSPHWGTPRVGGRAMHIYPIDFFYNQDGSEVSFTHILNGEYAACPIIYDDLGKPWPAPRGLIRFKDGVSHISVLASVGSKLTMRAFDRHNNYLGSSGIAYDNTDRVCEGGPSTFTRMNITREKTDIYRIEFIGYTNQWHIDDLVIGGLTLPDEEIDYEKIAEIAESLIGIPYLDYQIGWDYTLETYLNDFTEPHEYWNPEIGDFAYEIGISDVGLVLWSYNSELYDGKTHLVKWSTIDDMAKHDFTKEVLDTVQMGDILFGDSNSDGNLDKIGIITLDGKLITADEVNGVHYIESWQITPDPDPKYYRLPDKVTGGHSPIKRH